MNEVIPGQKKLYPSLGPLKLKSFESLLMVFNQPNLNNRVYRLETEEDKKHWEKSFLNKPLDHTGLVVKELKWIDNPDGTISMIGVFK